LQSRKPANTEEGTHVTTENNKHSVSRFIDEVINQAKMAAADEFVATDFIERDPLPGQEQGLEGLKQWLSMYLAAFPDVHWTIEEQIAEGDKVVTRFTWHGTHLGDFIGIPPTGRQVTVSGVVIDTLNGGKLVDSRMLMDALTLMQQLGVIPAPG
jgi:steroid delta-isomerase-like uncharacterized protein